jgi:hypothetical protein
VHLAKTGTDMFEFMKMHLKRFVALWQQWHQIITLETDQITPHG